MVAKLLTTVKFCSSLYFEPNLHFSIYYVLDVGEVGEVGEVG